MEVYPRPKKAGRPRIGNGKLALNICLDRRLVELLRHKRKGRISKDIEQALFFFYLHKEDYEHQTRVLDTVPRVKCIKCGVVFSALLGKCPECMELAVVFMGEPKLNDTIEDERLENESYYHEVDKANE